MTNTEIKRYRVFTDLNGKTLPCGKVVWRSTVAGTGWKYYDSNDKVRSRKFWDTAIAAARSGTWAGCTIEPLN